MPKVKKTEQTEKKKTSSLTLSVFDLSGKEKKFLELSKEIFSQEAKPTLLAQAVRVYLANQRSGTASAKTRGEVAGSTRKIYRQKGTGRARHGSIKAPIFVGGGVVGGPSPKDHSLEFNKVQRQKAFFGSLTLKLKEKNIIGLEDQALKDASKTKIVANFLKSLNLKRDKVTFVLPKIEKNNFVLSVRNIEGAEILEASSLNTYQVLNTGTLIFFESAVNQLEKHFIKK